MALTGEDIDRTVTGMVFTALGLILGVFTGWQLLSAGVPGMVSLLVGVVPGFLLALVLTVVGVYLLGDGPTGEHARRLLAWALASGSFGALSAGLFVLYETNRGVVIHEAPLVVANTAAGFAVFGLVVGRFDVQARQRAEELARYKELVENIPVGIFRTTPGPDGEFVEVNPAMVDLVGAESADELLSKSVSDIDIDADERETLSERLLEEGLVVEHEQEYQRFDGERFWASLTAMRFDADGQTYFDGILEDITERKRYKERLERHNDQLEVLNDMLRHDVRNDMAVIRSRAEHLRSVADGHDTDIDALLSRTDHVVELTETARDLTTVVSADRERDHHPVDLTETLRQEIEATRQANPDATITVDDVPSVPVRANDMLSSVFQNLLSNAVRHNDGDHPRIDVWATTTEDAVTVHVADDGPGIPDEQKEAIFEHGQKATDSSGTGLGLYLVATLVDQCGGTVTVRDRADDDPPHVRVGEEQRGAVFSVTLLRAETESREDDDSWYD